MSRKVSGQNNYRVVVDPRGLGDFGSVRVGDDLICTNEADRQQRYKERCEDIARDIKRHVDYVKCVTVECDDTYACEHCGRHWTEANAEYNGGCCDADQDAEDARQIAKVTA